MRICGQEIELFIGTKEQRNKGTKKYSVAIHDLNIAAMYCDTLFAMDKGRIVGWGTSEELLTETFIYRLFGVRAR